MTRRKQDAPQRLHGLENSDKSLHVEDSVDYKPVISDSGVRDGGGDSCSDEDSSDDMHVVVSTVQACVLGSGLVNRQSSPSSPSPSPGGQMSDRGQGQECTCHSNGSSVGCSREVCSSNSCRSRKQQTSDLSHLTEGFPPSEPLSRCTSTRHTQNSSTSSMASSPAPSSTCINPQMALVMPVGLVYNSQNHMQPGVTYFTSSTCQQQDDQPLDLSRKAARSASFSSTQTKLVVLRNRSCSDSVTNIPPPSNDFSSLRSLQQRFGDDVPLHPSHKSAAMVIPLPTNITCKSVMSLHGEWSAGEAPPSTGLERLHPSPQAGLSDKHDITQSSAVFGVSQGESNMATSPVLGDEPANGGWNRHTTHRCSCQNIFSTLYSLSLHLQETGHTLSSSKASSPMDYPKLVRGQDMWLSQESEQTRRILRCIQCGQSFESLPLLTVHMMQTQHYTKIVNSDHARRPHKCSTYCGRELDQECIFKCKVCHETFSDMGGLANHMVMSGHHRKPLSRHVANPVISSDVSAISRQGKRKRCIQDDSIPIAVAASSFTVASMLNYRRKLNGVSKSGEKDFSELDTNGDSVSPDSMSPGLVTCDICGENVTTLSLNSHARECLQQKVEVIESLRNKLALEEAFLSRSEGKRLKPNFSLDSAICQQKGISTDHESVSSEEQETGCGKGSEKSEYSMEITFPERSHSLPSTDLTQMIKHSASPSTIFCASPSARLSTSPSARLSTSPSARLSTSPSARLSTSPSARLSTSPGAIPSTSPSTRLFASPSDLHEVPHKKWCSHGESRQDVNKTNMCFLSPSGDNWPVNFNKRTDSPTINLQFTACVQYTNLDEDNLHEEVAHKLKSEPGHGDSGGCDSEQDLVSDALIKVEQHRERLSSPSHVMESGLDSLDCTYSALYQLDLFSRGLHLSPPKRTISLEPKLPIHQHLKVPSKKEALPHIKSPPRIRSPHTVSSSPLPHLKPESPSKVNMAFDIIDPNVEPQGVASAPSALEAMESFINKSFSAKPQISSPSLTSMFSPFRNCFPNPGSLLPHGGLLLDSANATTSHLAKFSRFFRMMPGVPVYSEMASSPAVDRIKRGASINRSQLDTTNTEALLSLSEYHLRTFAPIPSVKIPVGRYKLEPLKDGTIYQGDISSLNNSVENVSTFKKGDHTFRSSSEVLNAPKIHKCKSSPDSLAVHESHQLCCSPGGFVVEKKHKYCSSANSLIVQQNRQFCRSPDLSIAHTNRKFGRPSDKLVVATIGHDHYQTVDNISGNRQIQTHCTDDNISQRPFLVEPRNSSSQPPHAEPINVELDRKGGEELQLHLGTVSSKRSTADLGCSQPGGELVADVKSEGDKEDVVWEDDAIVSNDEIMTDATEVSRSEGKINVDNSQVNTGLENGTDVKKSQDIVGENSQVNLQAETSKLTFEMEVDRRKDHKEIEETMFNVLADGSEVDKNVIVKRESECSLYEGKQIKERFTNPTEESARETHFNLSLQVHENMCTKPTVTGDEFRHKFRQEARLDGTDVDAEICSSTNTLVNKNYYFAQEEIQQEVDEAAVSVTVCEDIQVGSLKDSFSNEHFQRSIRLNNCKPDSQNKTACTKFATPWTNSVLIEEEVSRGRSVLYSDASSEDCDISPDDSKCDISDVNVDTHNIIEVITDEARLNIDQQQCEQDKQQCKQVELRVDKINHNNVSSDDNVSSRHVCTESINKVTNAENKYGIDRGCTRSGKHCENETKFKGDHFENKVQCGNVKMEGTGLKHLNGGHVPNQGRSTRFTKISASDCGVRGFSICENKSFVQSVDKLSQIKLEYIEKIGTLQNDMIKGYQYRPTSLQKKNNQGISVQTENQKCLSESESNLNTNEIDRLKKHKSALDYLSSFVYSQPQSTEHPLDNLQQLLSTNDVTYLPTDNDLADVSHKYCSSDLLTSQSTISSTGQMCGTCSIEDNEDDETCLTESGTSEGHGHHHKCVACRRGFASKGSYRYHLSRCHLSGVKKYSIKETFSRSPYVYLPLDHTVKLSKYYKMTQQLSHEGK